jgi:hypothetical protein
MADCDDVHIVLKTFICIFHRWLHASFFLGLLLNPEDGGDMFLCKVR